MRRAIKTFLFSLILLCGIGLAAAPVVVLAEDLNSEVCSSVPAGQEKPLVCRDTSPNNPIVGPEGIITKVISALVYVAGVISVVIIVVSGLRYVVSGGDANGVQGAKDGIMYALAGLVIAIFAQAIVAFVLNKL